METDQNSNDVQWYELVESYFGRRKYSDRDVLIAFSEIKRKFPDITNATICAAIRKAADYTQAKECRSDIGTIHILSWLGYKAKSKYGYDLI